jgi:hypothetical protein
LAKITTQPRFFVATKKNQTFALTESINCSKFFRRQSSGETIAT